MSSDRLNPFGFTPREMEVCDLLVQTHTAKGVAQALGIAVSTAECHLIRAREKSGARNYLALAVAHDRVQRGAA